MTDKNLKNIKEKYEKYLIIKTYIEKLQTRQKELVSISEEVKEYIDNKKIINGLNYDGIGDHTNKYLLFEAVNSEEIKSSNGIYIYVNTYRHKRSDGKHIDIGHDYITKYSDPKADYRIYVNIEYLYKNNQVSIPIKECELFEKNNVVLYPSNDISWFDLYSDVRMMFFETCINEGQDKAVEKVKQIGKR